LDIKSVLKKHEESLLKLPDVTGVGIGEEAGKEVIIVFVKEKSAKSLKEPQPIVPKNLEGYEVRVEAEIRVDQP
jgi:hypothetical protein